MKSVIPSFDLLQNIVEKAQKEGYPPSIEILVSRNFKPLFRKHWGKRYKYFDVASLTKVMATTASLMALFDRGFFELDAAVSSHLGFLKGTRAGDIPIRRLLNHTSGLVAHEKFYEDLRKLDLLARTEYMQRRARTFEVKPLKKAVYSDLDLILLGWLVEKLTALPLDAAAFKLVFDPLDLKDTFFNGGNKPRGDRKHYAPTEKCPWRKKTLQGEVHDDNTWAMGGVAGHAGLFSTVDDVHHFAGEMLRAWNGEGFVSKKTARLFLSRSIEAKMGDWTLGWMMPTPGKSSAGSLAPEHAIGHTGFVGTSLWMDPREEVVVVILANRVHPTRDDERFVALRPRLHDAIWTQLKD